MKKTLLIMAAGMGSRFGGLKQIEPFGPNNEFIIDYSIYDAIKAGFNKVVFIIKEENYDIFRETIGKRIEDKIEVHYCFQKLDDIPSKYKLPESRIKPLGTAHAIYSSRNSIDENFAVINSDDFYGRDAFLTISKFLDELNNSDCAIVGYKVINTLTENGSVKRGVISSSNGNLNTIIESSIIVDDGKIKASPLDGSESFIMNENDLVSMNMLGFSKNIFPYLEEKLIDFFEQNKNNLETEEFLIPNVIQSGILENKFNAKVLTTKAKWEGVTYKEDKESVVNAIKKLIDDKVYPENLWK